jgi:serine/threonine-protein kinase
VQRANRTIREIAGALHAHFMVEGSVRTDGGRMRITAQLIEAQGETQLWADSFERPLSDCLLVQADVATRIVRAVAVELLPDRAPTPSSGTRNLDAYQAFLKGRYYWQRPGEDGLRECLTFYQQALTLDPHFGDAHGALARATVAAAEYYIQEPRKAFDSAELAASRALAIDPAQSEAYTALAEIRRARDWNWDGAEDAFRRALAINPSNEGARRLYGVFLASRGQTSQAVAMTDIACELDPLCLVSNTGAAWVRFITGDYGWVIDRCRHTIDMAADFPAPHRLLAAAMLQMGDVAGSVSYLDSAPAVVRQEPTTIAWLAHAVAVSGDTARAKSLLCQLEETSRSRYVSPYHRAIGWAGLGNADTAFTLLARACDDRDPSLMHLVSEPRFNVLRSDARYRALTQRIGLDMESPAHV